MLRSCATKAEHTSKGDSSESLHPLAINNGVRPTAVGVAHYLMCVTSQESDSEDRYIKGQARLMLLYSKWNMESIDDYYTDGGLSPKLYM